MANLPEELRLMARSVAQSHPPQCIAQTIGARLQRLALRCRSGSGIWCSILRLSKASQTA